MTGECGSVCGTLLSQTGHAREYPRKVDIPKKELWGCSEYLYILKCLLDSHQIFYCLCFCHTRRFKITLAWQPERQWIEAEWELKIRQPSLMARVHRSAANIQQLKMGLCLNNFLSGKQSVVFHQTL